MHTRQHIFAALLLCLVLVPIPVNAQESGYFQVLYDTTTPVVTDYRTDMGYAVFVNYDGVRMLFDTGANPATLRNNMEVAGIDPVSLDLVAISHSHYDHAGGLPYIRETTRELPVYVPPGPPLDDGEFRHVEDHLEISPRLFLIRSHTDQPTSGIADELSLLILTAQGPYLITACSHTGVPTILDRAERLAGEAIFYYTGGARLNFRPPGDTLETGRLLKRRGVAHVSPGHCSAGHQVAAAFRHEFGGGYVSSRLGEKVALQAIRAGKTPE